MRWQTIDMPQTYWLDAALVAASAVREAVSGVVAPPFVMTNEDLSAPEAQIADLRSWLAATLPLLRVQAGLLADWHGEVSGATDQLYPELVRYADVVAATCTGAASRPEISGLDFDLAIVDEAGQIGVADVLVPLVRARRGVLVGDHRQLPPFLDSEVKQWGKSVDDGVTRELMAKSALELLIGDLPDSHVVWLTGQRRMPAMIADFVSEAFIRGGCAPALSVCMLIQSSAGRWRSWIRLGCPAGNDMRSRDGRGSGGDSPVTQTRRRPRCWSHWLQVTTGT